MQKELYAPPFFLIQEHVRLALKEDFGHGADITSECVLPFDTRAYVHMVARENLTLAGTVCARAAFDIIDSTIDYEQHFQDGDILSKGDVIFTLKGNARSILSAERVALNYVGHLSGIATQTAQYVQKIKGTKTRVTCTRKTLPHLRMLQKYAVRVGGGFSHRYGLDDGILIKDNHIAACGGIQSAVDYARASISHTTKIQVECDTLPQVNQALKAKADIIMLDNMTCDQMREAVSIIKDQAIIEASGGITLDTISEIAQTGIDIISIGALTHSIKNADVAFDFNESI